jgi:hypothetical protein
MRAKQADPKHVPRHISQAIVSTVFTLAFAVLAGHDYVHAEPTTRILGWGLMSAGSGLRAAWSFADRELRKSFAYWLARIIFTAGLLTVFATQIH